ncbi:hypothetical protein [Corynebacterium sp. H130]|uniref:hypothetical protein n=1 Tax=Corynebacterium sp. H130 TaxID=3133444 RepID=UPI0030A6A741
MAIVVGNWTYLCVVRPNIQWTGQWESDFEIQQFLLLLVAVGFAIFSIVGVTNWRDAAILLFGILIDLVIGRAIFATSIPLYLDTIGAVMVAVLLGPRQGAICAAGVSLLLYPVAPALLPLAIVNITVAALAGIMAQFGGFNGPGPITMNALFTGVVSTIVSAPVSLYLAMNYSTNGENVQFSVAESIIGSLLGPPFSGGTPSDLLDKLVVFWLVYWIIRGLMHTPVLRLLKSDPLRY